MLGWPEAQRWPPELALSMQHGEALPRAAPLSRWERSGCPDLLDMVLRPTWPILVRITLTGHAAGEGSSSSCADSNSCFPGGPASSIPLSCLWKPCPFLNPPKNTYMLEPPRSQIISPPCLALPPLFFAIVLLQRVVYTSRFFLTLRLRLHLSEAFDSSCFLITNNQQRKNSQRFCILNISRLHHLLVISMAATLVLTLITFDLDNCNDLWTLSLLIFMHIISGLFSLNHNSEPGLLLLKICHWLSQK